MIFLGKYRQLSRQEIIDCIVTFPRRPSSIDAFDYIKELGVNYEINYPMANGFPLDCTRKRRDPSLRIKNYHLLKPGDEENLKLAVALLGPLSVSIKVSVNFLFYKDGIFYEPTCTEDPEEVNHSVLLVGYGTNPDGVDFWIIQNNFGMKWGQGGYGKIARNTVYNCGITSAAVFPEMFD